MREDAGCFGAAGQHPAELERVHLDDLVGALAPVAAAGSFVYSPPDVPHTFSVVSDESRFLLGTEPAGFEAFVRACAEPAGASTLPHPGTSAPGPARLAELAAEHAIEILGPPGQPA